MSTAEQIKLLIGLQRLDSQIYKIRRELQDQPALIRGLEEAFRQKESALKKTEDDLKASMIRRKEREIDLQTKEEGIKKLQGQLYQIKTNKEYQAMEKEIASQKADVSVIEEDIIKILDTIDEHAKEAARQKDILNSERGLLEEEKRRVDAKTKELDAGLQALSLQRNELAPKVDKEYLAKYERILHSKNGLAMVGVESEACGGCNINLPPQVINEIRMKQELIFCGSCARILFIDE